MAAIINQATANLTSPQLFPARDWDRSGKRFGSTQKAKSDLGFSAEIEITEGINVLVDWTKKNRELIKTCMERHAPFMVEEI